MLKLFQDLPHHLRRKVFFIQSPSMSITPRTKGMPSAAWLRTGYIAMHEPMTTAIEAPAREMGIGSVSFEPQGCYATGRDGMDATESTTISTTCHNLNS